MTSNDAFPKIEALFEPSSPIAARYNDLVPLKLRQILPREIFAQPRLTSDDCDEQRRQFEEAMPLFFYTPLVAVPCNVSFSVLSRYRQNSFKFFFEMISRWLVPGKRLNVMMIYAIDFRIPELGSDVYTLCDVMVKVECNADMQELLRNLPIIETETRLGVDSAYYARKILEIKGLSSDEKTAMIQEYVAYLSGRMPEAFDNDVLNEMQHVLVKCRDDFKAQRESRHMSRIICVHYLFRKALRDAIAIAPQKRHLSVKLMKARIRDGNRSRTVLGVLVGVNFLKDNELFEERHLLQAIRAYVPNVSAVEGSFFENMRGSEDICTLYLEVEKEDGSEFTTDEIRKLRRELPTDLKDRIESLIHPIFMPRNEEEIMRNILSLSGQIKYLRDIPQVIISFDEQTDRHLYFTVILLRVLKPTDQPIQKLFQTADTSIEYLHDRVKMVGYIRKKYPKEASVFRLKLKKEKFLRKDHSIDMFLARRYVVDQLCDILGEIRDYNGGMISKQNELLNQVKSLLVKRGKYHDLLLENLFHSLTPAVMRSVLEPVALKTLCLLLFDGVEAGFFEDARSVIKAHIEGPYLIVMITSDVLHLKEKMARAVAKLQILPSDLATAYVTVYEAPCLGYIYRCEDREKQRVFLAALEEVLHVRAQKAVSDEVLFPDLSTTAHT